MKHKENYEEQILRKTEWSYKVGNKERKKLKIFFFQ
jgi:hypothetical protein